VLKQRRAFLVTSALTVLTVFTADLAVAMAPPQLTKPRPPPAFMWRPPVLTIPSRDVTPIQIQSLRVSGDAHGRVATTEIDMTFYNPNSRVLEGELQFPLYDGQRVVSFSMDVNGTMRDAVPVDKARGQQIFEDVIRGRIDPGLLEVTQGNNFKLTVYPIPARGTKRVLIRLNETLATQNGQSVYRLPLGFAQRAESFSLDVKISGLEQVPVIQRGAPGDAIFTKETFRNSYRLRASRNDFAGEGPIEILFADGKGAVVETSVFEGKTYFTADLALPSREAPRDIPKRIGIVWDASASARSRDHARELQLLDSYFSAMRDGEVRLTEIRDTAEAPRSFRISNGDWRALRNALENMAYDGATNLHAFVPETSVGEYLLFSDGLSNFGNASEKPFPDMRVPLYTISSAVKADHAFLKHIAQRSGARTIDVSREAAPIASRMLLQHSTRIVSAVVDGGSQLKQSNVFINGERTQFAGMLTSMPATLHVTVQHPDGKRETISTEISAGNAPTDNGAAHIWAAMRIAELDAEYQLNRAEIKRLGQRFRMVTRETSLIILDRIEDYARHEIEPPQELRAEYARVLAQFTQTRSTERRNHLSNVLRQFEEKTSWWNHDFPKGPLYRGDRRRDKEGPFDGVPEPVLSPSSVEAKRAEALAAPPAPASPAAAAQSAPVRAMQMQRASTADSAETSARFTPSTSTIRLQKWQPNAPYMTRLREAADGELYRIYLDEVPSYAASTAFYLDAADVFVQRGMKALATRVLSNLAEMDLENRHILRVLGHRLMQAGRADLAIPTFKRVLQLSPDEPQSYRDLGLAFAADKQAQKAVDALYEVVTRPWHNRFPGVEMIALAELNAIAAQSRVDLSRIDTRLIKNLPLDLRAVLSWDADNTDIDLWVTDPNGEKTFYGKPLSYQGGRMSADFTGGYGPEEFSLKYAKPGKYKIEAQYFGDRRQNVAGPTTLQVRVTTGFGTSRQREQMMTLRLKDARETVYVGEITVGG
jgi:Ca-activated chloride channel homolog